jgi:PPM family protein phosphatase
MTDRIDTGDTIEIPGFPAMDGVEHLQRLPLFRTLTFDETARLFSIARAEHRAAGSVIIDEDQLGHALYIVKSGQVRVERRGVELSTRGPGELLGEMSLVDDVLTSARVVAVGSCELMSIERTAFDALLARDAALAVKVYKAFCRTLSDRLRKTNDLLPQRDLIA